MAVEYEFCPGEVVVFCEAVRNQWHQRLDGARIAWVFRSKAARHAGKAVLGTSRKLSALHALLTLGPAGDRGGFDLAVVLAKDLWDTLSVDKRRAIVDHELCHFDLDGEGGFLLRPHDLEDFVEVVQRHGLQWREQVAYAQACQQRTLEFANAAREADAE
ncbi:MAG TPA: putative metallopeptidase [Planctomycetota bacterium]|nr:putative metallopeptidase [Planctomycetota bacterium]HRR82920.1 putative metallopeptidase [Planctomycetota bacterium]HRT95774.1 putative metallopeptidase [Planctomycetota bacterium]